MNTETQALEAQLPHGKLMAEENLAFEDLPMDIRTEIRGLRMQLGKLQTDNRKDANSKKSAYIADLIQNWLEEGIEDEDDTNGAGADGDQGQAAATGGTPPAQAAAAQSAQQPATTTAAAEPAKTEPIVTNPPVPEKTDEFMLGEINAILEANRFITKEQLVGIIGSSNFGDSVTVGTVRYKKLFGAHRYVRG